jgi:myo-inositol-1(or 4)-monophosphatase
MMSDTRSDPLDVALSVAEEAGRLVLEGLGRRPAAHAKAASTDLVTEYDQRSEALIVSRLGAAFPGDAILAEEGGLRDGSRPERRWLVDPLDGTTNFAHGLPLCSVSIALEVAGAVEVGVVAAPGLGWTFAARRGGGATWNGAPIAVSDAASLDGAMLVTGFPYDRQTSPDNNFDQFIAFQRRAQAVRRLGSASVDLCLVARGTFEGYWEMKLKPWDLAAGALIVLEAGGRVTGWRGEPFALERGALVASNGRVHQALLDVLAEAGIPASAR